MQAQDRSDTGYQSYMLRMWRKWDGQGRPMWCASLQEPGSRRTMSFEDANAMFAYLQSKLGIEAEVPAEHGHAQHGQYGQHSQHSQHGQHGRQEQHPQGEQQAAQKG